MPAVVIKPFWVFVVQPIKPKWHLRKEDFEGPYTWQPAREFLVTAQPQDENRENQAMQALWKALKIVYTWRVGILQSTAANQLPYLHYINPYKYISTTLPPICLVSPSDLQSWIEDYWIPLWMAARAAMDFFSWLWTVNGETMHCFTAEAWSTTPCAGLVR